jgi:hypothetical protein
MKLAVFALVIKLIGNSGGTAVNVLYYKSGGRRLDPR